MFASEESSEWKVHCMWLALKQGPILRKFCCEQTGAQECKSGNVMMGPFSHNKNDIMQTKFTPRCKLE